MPQISLTVKFRDVNAKWRLYVKWWINTIYVDEKTYEKLYVWRTYKFNYEHQSIFNEKNYYFWEWYKSCTLLEHNEDILEDTNEDVYNPYTIKEKSIRNAIKTLTDEAEFISENEEIREELLTYIRSIYNVEEISDKNEEKIEYKAPEKIVYDIKNDIKIEKINTPENKDGHEFDDDMPF